MYRREIDGLRAIAVMSVLLFHAGIKPFHGGYIGVDIFFVISGYLITTIIIKELNADTFKLSEFYYRRIRRIFPALLVVIIVSTLFAWLILIPRDFIQYSKSLQYISVFLSNIFFYKQSGYFDSSSELKPLLHTWSLSVEEQYYLLFPFLITLIHKKEKPFIVHIFAAGIVLSLLFAHHKAQIKPDAAFFLLTSRIWEILAGALTAKLVISSERELSGHELSSWLAIGLVSYGVFFLDENTLYPSLGIILPVIGTCLLIVFATPSTTVGKILASKYAVNIGLISYSTYLWHQPVLAFSRYRFGENLNISMLLLLITLSILMGYLSWRYIEQPFRKKEVCENNNTLLFAFVLSSITIFSVGATIVKQKGVPERYSKEDLYLVNLDLKTQENYVKKRFNELTLLPFTSKSKVKILIIGDSYAQDLVNALYEAGLNNEFELSTYDISARCGNLYVSDDLSPFISDKYQDYCSKHEGYKNNQLKKLMLEADQIWLSSSWKQWQAKFIAKSVTNLKREYGDKIIIFGRKHFGEINPQILIHKPLDSRVHYRNPLPEEHVLTNEIMIQQLSNENFINISNMLCGEEKTCGVLSPDGRLLSFDGGHLTKEGATFFGTRLKRLEYIRSLTSQK